MQSQSLSLSLSAKANSQIVSSRSINYRSLLREFLFSCHLRIIDRQATFRVRMSCVFFYIVSSLYFALLHSARLVIIIDKLLKSELFCILMSSLSSPLAMYKATEIELKKKETTTTTKIQNTIKISKCVASITWEFWNLLTSIYEHENDGPTYWIGLAIESVGLRKYFLTSKFEWMIENKWAISECNSPIAPRLSLFSSLFELQRQQ